MELIIAIATLCQVGTGRPYLTGTDEYQLKCQQYYVQCVEKKRIAQCIKERVVK